MNNKKDKQVSQKIKQCENERRVDDLINLVENKTRTERHLEEHSDIGDPDRLHHVYEVQNVREEQIQNLKSAIVYGDNNKNSTEDQLENLKKNYTFAKGYIEHNADHMDSKALENLNEKQENRKDQMDILQ
jgi:hypothetical protein